VAVVESGGQDRRWHSSQLANPARWASRSRLAVMRSMSVRTSAAPIVVCRKPRRPSRARIRSYPTCRIRAVVAALSRNCIMSATASATVGSLTGAHTESKPIGEVHTSAVGLAVRRYDQRVGQALIMRPRHGQVGRAGAATSGTTVSAG